MSEGGQTTAQGQAPEFAVVGEPVSEPHQAVVVGEPQEAAAPVLGEPVPLPNGLQGQEGNPAIPPQGAAELPAVNGVQEVSHLHHHQDEASVQDQEDGVALSRASEESPNSSESPAELNPCPSEAPAEENPNPPDALAAENPNPPDTPAEELPAEETASVPDAPADENSSAAEEPNATAAPADTADAPDPVEVSYEIPIENSLLLEEASSLQKEGAPSDVFPADPVASAAPEEVALLTQVDLSHEASDASQQEGPPAEAIAPPAIAEEQFVTVGKVSEAAQEEAIATEPVQIFPRDAPLQEDVASDIVTEKPIDEEAKEIKPSEEEPSVEGTKIIESHGAESHARESAVAPYEGPSLEVTHVTPEEVSQAEGSTDEDQNPLDEGTILQSHQVQHHAEAPLDAVGSGEILIPSQTTREIPAEECTLGQSLIEEPLAEESTLKQTLTEWTESSQDNVPSANGKSVEDANHVVDREQEFSKEDEKAKGKEKPSSRIKLPLIVTGLAIAAVGVAVASISRTH